MSENTKLSPPSTDAVEARQKQWAAGVGLDLAREEVEDELRAHPDANDLDTVPVSVGSLRTLLSALGSEGEDSKQPSIRFTPAMLVALESELAAMPDPEHVPERIAGARAAMHAVGAPYSPETTNPLYYPLLFLVEAVEAERRWMENDANPRAALSTPGSDGERLPRATVQAIVNATYRACSNAEFGEGNMGDWDVDLRAIVNRFSTPGDA